MNNKKFELEQYLKKNFNCTDSTTLEKEGITVFSSTQVRIKTQKPKEYYEITTKNITPNGEVLILNHDDNIKHEANITSLNNQSLMVGDVLFSGRAKLSRVGIITEKTLAHKLPVVAINGTIIIRTGDPKLAKFIKYYLELDEICNYINDDSRSKSKNGTRSISPRLIQDLLFPNILDNDFSLFIGNSAYYDSIIHKVELFASKMGDLSKKHKNVAHRKDIEDPSSYSFDTWKEFDREIDKMLQLFTDTK